MLLGSAQQHPMRPPANLERSIFAQKNKTKQNKTCNFSKLWEENGVKFYKKETPLQSLRNIINTKLLTVKASAKTHEACS